MRGGNELNDGWLPGDWTSKSAWLESAHRAARVLRQQVAQATPQQLRQALEVASRLNPGPWGGDFHEVDFGDWKGAEVTWKEHREGTVVWVHGGAFAFGSPRVYRAAAVHLAKNTRCRVLMPTYRLAPEHTYPDAHDDVCRALEEIRATFGEVVVVGDSAGANLVLGSLARLHEQGARNPFRAVALLSPWCDLRPSAKSVVRNTVAHSPFDCEDSMEYSHNYLGEHPSDDPLVCPLVNGDFRHLPPVYLEWAEDEFLTPDIEVLRDQMEKSGVSLTVRTESQAVHGWQVLPDLLPEAKRSSVALGGWIRGQLGLSEKTD